MQYRSLFTLPVTAGATVLAERAVGANGQHAAAAGRMFGIARAGAATGEQFPVDVIGSAIATAGAPVALGAELQVGTEGKLITRTNGVGVAIALEAAAGDDSRFEVLLLPSGTPAA
jgi:hypothetical protein